MTTGYGDGSASLLALCGCNKVYRASRVFSVKEESRLGRSCMTRPYFSSTAFGINTSSTQLSSSSSAPVLSRFFVVANCVPRSDAPGTFVVQAFSQLQWSGEQQPICRRRRFQLRVSSVAPGECSSLLGTRVLSWRPLPLVLRFRFISSAGTPLRALTTS